MSKAWPGACYWNDSMNRMSLAALLSCLPLVAWADNPVKLDTPVSGWRAGDGSAANYRQVVNYPASSVNVAADQATTARIRGAIESQPKDRPATLVVNGVSMPLKVDADGSFDRPFAFPSGSNSVEVRNAAGQSRRVQFYHGGGGGEVPAKLRVLLSWDSDNTDLDLHLVTPGRRPCLVWQSFAGQRRDPGCRRHHRLRPGNHRHADAAEGALPGLRQLLRRWLRQQRGWRRTGRPGPDHGAHHPGHRRGHAERETGNLPGADAQAWRADAGEALQLSVGACARSHRADNAPGVIRRRSGIGVINPWPDGGAHAAANGSWAQAGCSPCQVSIASCAARNASIAAGTPA